MSFGLGESPSKEGSDEITEIETERKEGESSRLVGLVADLAPVYTSLARSESTRMEEDSHD